MADPGGGGGVMTRPIYIFWKLTIYNKKCILAGSALIIKIGIVFALQTGF